MIVRVGHRSDSVGILTYLLYFCVLTGSTHRVAESLLRRSGRRVVRRVRRFCFLQTADGPGVYMFNL